MPPITIQDLRDLLPIADRDNGADRLNITLSARQDFDRQHPQGQRCEKPLLLNIGPINGPLVDLELGAGLYLIGRWPKSSIHVPARWVSNLHCLLEVREDGVVTIQDIGSTHGIMVNEAPIATYEVRIVEPSQSILVGGIFNLVVS